MWGTGSFGFWFDEGLDFRVRADDLFLNLGLVFLGMGISIGEGYVEDLDDDTN